MTFMQLQQLPALFHLNSHHPSQVTVRSRNRWTLHQVGGIEKEVYSYACSYTSIPPRKKSHGMDSEPNGSSRFVLPRAAVRTPRSSPSRSFQVPGRTKRRYSARRARCFSISGWRKSGHAWPAGNDQSATGWYVG